MARSTHGTRPSRASQDAALAGDEGAREALWRGTHADPHRYLGIHRLDRDSDDETRTVVRALRPDARRVTLLLAEGSTGAPDATARETAMREVGPGLWAAFLPAEAGASVRYRLRVERRDGTTLELDDPYRFPPTLGDADLYHLSQGSHRRLWQALGARPTTVDGVEGFAFSVWAPNAQGVSVVGEFCGWDGRRLPMRRLGSSGVWELFVPGLASGALYKFEILGHAAPGEDAAPHLKADPLARWAEVAPGTASRTHLSEFRWRDGEWMARRDARDPRREPLAAYEVHLPSWGRHEDETPSYRQLAPALVDHVKALGFDHLELMPIAEHPFDGSWGYQLTGYFAPTARFGDPDDFRWFVDYCHRHGVGVLIDWVPAHFVRDAHGLGRFDGTALYEHQDPRRGEHPDWGTYIFNYDRWEVQNFLVANALYWLEEFHVDGLRVDAVASMLYLDYSRGEGEWLPNEHGGRENYGAIEMLRAMNRLVHAEYPGCITIAEESTAWPGVTDDPDHGGLGFTFKWNMGWMHDTLQYFALDPLFRKHHHDRLTFAMVYEGSEAFVNPLSHDEVVHGKGSLYSKMPGDSWQKLANLRCLLGYQWTRPGKILLFMGSELASSREWSHERSLDWWLLDDPSRRGLHDFLAALGALYQRHPCLWRADHDPEGFEWISCVDRERSVLVYARYDGRGTPHVDLVDAEIGDETTGEPLVVVTEATGDHLVVVLNLTPVPRPGYRIGAPSSDAYEVVLCSDDERFGGSGYRAAHDAPERLETEPTPADGRPRSLSLMLPPLGILVLAPSSRVSSPAASLASSPAPAQTSARKEAS